MVTHSILHNSLCEYLCSFHIAFVRTLVYNIVTVKETDRPQAGKEHKMKIYKISTNAYDAFVTVDEYNKVRYFSTAAFVYDVDIRDVDDDTSWEDTCMGMDFGEFLGDAEIIDSADI